MFNRILVTAPRMRTLVIDSATEACSVALFEGDALLAGARRDARARPCRAAGADDRRAARQGPRRPDRRLARPGQLHRRAHRPRRRPRARARLAAPKCSAIRRWRWSRRWRACNAIRGPVTVCMTGGHGEWFVQDFGADGLPQAGLRSLTPDAGRCDDSHDRSSPAARPRRCARRRRQRRARHPARRARLSAPSAEPADKRPRPALRPPARCPAAEACRHDRRPRPDHGGHGGGLRSRLRRGLDPPPGVATRC